MTNELYAADFRRGPGDTKMPAMPRSYLYPQARVLFPSLPPQTVAAIEHVVTRKYRARRYEVVWRHAAALPTHRYPTPFPVHNQSWSASTDDGNRPVVCVRIAADWWTLRLRGGPQFHRQRRAFDSMVSGAATRGELALFEHGPALMCKMIAWIPREQPATRPDSVLAVRTAPDAPLVALNARDERIWIWDADHVRRWIAEHSRQLQRWSEDTKAEQRPVPAFAERCAAAVRKYHDRLDSACHQAAAHFGGYASRRKFSGVSYDDSEKSYCPQFPWARLKSLLAQKLDERGITFASGPATQESCEPLAEETANE